MIPASVWLAIRAVVDAIPHPIAAGCIGIGFGALAFTLAAPVKSRLDRARKSRSERTRATVRGLRTRYLLLLIVGVILTAFGTFLTINGGQINAVSQAAQAQALLDQTRQENEQARKEYEVKLHDVLVALNAAKQEQTRLLTEEKIKGLQKDLLAWADDFAARKPDKQHQIEQARLAEIQREVQLSSESAPLFSFALRFIEDSFRAYIKKTSAEIKLELPSLPENYFDPKVNTPPRAVRFKGKAEWLIYVQANPPANDNQAIVMMIGFTNSEGRNGSISLYKQPASGKLSVSVSAEAFSRHPDGLAMFGEYSMVDYEETLGRILQRLIEAQLADNQSD